MISKHLLDNILNESELIFFHQLNVFPYFDLMRIILFTINHLFVYSCNVFNYCYLSLKIQSNTCHLLTQLK